MHSTLTELLVKRDHVLFGGIAALAFSLAFFFEPKFVITIVCLVSLALALALYGRAVGEPLLIAALFALFISSYNPHIYTTGDILVGHISVFSVVAWTTGLVVLRVVYTYAETRFKWLLFSVGYLVALLILEYIGYYMLGIQLVGDEPSYLGLGVLHGPLSLHVIYTLAGPAYLAVIDFLRIR